MSGLEMIAAADLGVPVTPELVVLALVVVAAFGLKHAVHRRRFPDRLRCGTCGGSGSVTSKNLLRQKVKGPCPECKGSPWVPRGWS